MHATIFLHILRAQHQQLPRESEDEPQNMNDAQLACHAMHSAAKADEQQKQSFFVDESGNEVGCATQIRF